MYIQYVKILIKEILLVSLIHGALRILSLNDVGHFFMQTKKINFNIESRIMYKLHLNSTECISNLYCFVDPEKCMPTNEMPDVNNDSCPVLLIGTPMRDTLRDLMHR